MKFVIQRVTKASVKVGGNIIGQIDKGYMVLIDGPFTIVLDSKEIMG